MYYEEEFINEGNSFNNKINEFIEGEVNNRIGEIKTELENKTTLLEVTNKKLYNIIKENKELKLLKEQLEQFTIFKNITNENNFEELIKFFNLKNSNIEICGMYTEELPVWFKLLVIYYEDKDILFTLMDFFNIKYPTWAKQVKMPYDYNEEELELIFNNLRKMYVCNGQIFDNNIGFWYNEFRKELFDIFKVFKNSIYVEIPWQLLLRNPLLITDKNFDKMLKVIKTKKEHSYYFYKIQDYQKLSDEQIGEMAKILPKDHISDWHKRFIEINKNILKIIPELAKKFTDKITDNHYSTFYFLNYPIKTQINFIKNYDQNRGMYKKFELIKKMDISKEEKINFITEIAKIELDKEIKS